MWSPADLEVISKFFKAEVCVCEGGGVPGVTGFTRCCCLCYQVARRPFSGAAMLGFVRILLLPLPTLRSCVQLMQMHMVSTGHAVERSTDCVCVYFAGSSFWGCVAHFTVSDGAPGHRLARDGDYFFWSRVCWCCLPGQTAPGGEFVCCQVVPHRNQPPFLLLAGENGTHPGGWF